MVRSEFHDSTLVLLAHGSTVHPDSSFPAWMHAATLRRRAVFQDVIVAFWKQEPPVAQVLRGVFARRVFLTPLFIADGWFSETVLPIALGLRRPGEPSFERTQKLPDGRIVHYCQPVGSHPSMTDVLLARARGVTAQFPFPRAPTTSDTTLFIAGHGTSYSAGSRQSIEARVEALKGLGQYADVQPLFLEESPWIRDCWSRSETRDNVIVPFFISDGLHTREDIPIQLGEPESVVRRRLAEGQPTWRNPTERNGRRLWLAGAVGTDPGLTDVILERVREIGGGYRGTL